MVSSVASNAVEESQQYLSETSAQQSWTGAEPALQMLLGLSPDDEALPQYSEQPDFLSQVNQKEAKVRTESVHRDSGIIWCEAWQATRYLQFESLITFQPDNWSSS